jgi:hypothetical protein
MSPASPSSINHIKERVNSCRRRRRFLEKETGANALVVLSKPPRPRDLVAVLTDV